MPTFKLFRGSEELGTQRGWSEGQARCAPPPLTACLSVHEPPLTSSDVAARRCGRCSTRRARSRGRRREQRQSEAAGVSRPGAVWYLCVLALQLRAIRDRTARGGPARALARRRRASVSLRARHSALRLFSFPVYVSVTPAVRCAQGSLTNHVKGGARRGSLRTSPGVPRGGLWQTLALLRREQRASVRGPRPGGGGGGGARSCGHPGRGESRAGCAAK